MRVGIYLDLRNPPAWRRDWGSHYAWSLELAERADQLGIGSIWVTEHHFFEDGYLPQPLTFAAAIAARTTRARIGTAVLLAPLRSAVHIAEEAAVVDLVSGGRLELGLGSGYRVPEFAAFGIDFESRHRLLGHRVREVRSLLDEGGISPPPLQQRLPIWVGAMGVVGARRAARLGEGLLAVRRQWVEQYLDAWREAGREPGRAAAAGVVHMVLADDPEAAFAQIAPHAAYQWDTYNRYGVEGTGQSPPPPVDPRTLREPGPNGQPPRLQVVTPEQARAVLAERLDGLPVSDVYLWATVAGMPHDLAERNVELICTELVPAMASG